MSPSVFLAVRTAHPGLLPLLAKLKLPVVCLTREASTLLQTSADQTVSFSVSKPTAETKITAHDVLIANLTVERFDVFLHSLIRTCCERKAFVLTRFEDYETFSLEDASAKERLLVKALEYCAGFDHMLAKRVGYSASKEFQPGSCSFTFDESASTSAILSALKNILSSEGTATPQYVLGAKKENDMGPSNQAMVICNQVAPDDDVEDERWDMIFVFFSDGESISPSANDADFEPALVLVSSRGDEGDISIARSAAIRAASRIVDTCAFSDAPYVGPIVLRVSRRGRVVDAVTSDQPLLERILKSIDNLEVMIEASCSKAFGYAPTMVVKKIQEPRKIRLAAIGSTAGGSSLQPILDELSKEGTQLNQLCELAVTLADKEKAGVLRRASEAGIPSLFLSAKSKTREEFDSRVTDELQRRGVDLILLVGYMRIVSADFCRTWEGRMLNVHPSLLPDFAGGMDLQVHSAVLQAKKEISGCTVHLVTEIVDGGPIVLQKSCPVYPETDTPETLKARVQALEGPCLIESILHFAEKKGFFGQEDKLTYELAGVSTSRGDELVERIKNFCKATRRPGCNPDLGGFGACFDLHSLGFKDPVLVSGTDGVGTKLVLAQELRDETTVGIDLVAMSVNDLIVQGAEPMFFLDYFACGKLDLDQGSKVVSGIARGCELAGCALIGGETAEMPGMYPVGTYDLAGFALGVVERSNLLPKQVKAGDVLIGLRSSGIHSNGYSLARKIVKGMDLNQPAPFPSTRSTLKEILMEPTRVYWKMLQRVLRLDLVQALSHITGSGLPGNLPRVYDESKLQAEVNLSSWTPAAIFTFLSEQGPVSLKEMLSTFNCGVGMVLFVSPENVQRVMDLLPEEDTFVMGEMKAKSSESDPSVTFIGESPLGKAGEGGITYSSAGVDIHAGDNFVDNIKPLCKQTRRPGCMALELGGFGSLFDINEMITKFKEPIIVAGTDGVGTKLLLGQQLKRHSTVGIDLVGAEPVFFLDYLACGKLKIDELTQVVDGIAEGCLQSECALVGGETAEMPGMYSEEEYDLAGFAVGIVDRERLLPHPSQEGDFLIGLRSSGVHSNGYSLVRKVVEKANADLEGPPHFESTHKTLGEALLEPTRIYWKMLKRPLEEQMLVGMSHITGSGIDGNLPRVFNEKELYAEVDCSKWVPNPVFKWLQEKGNIDTREMLATFNCGLGMILICRGMEKSQAVIDMIGPEFCVGIVGSLKRKSNVDDDSVVFVNENALFAQ